MALSFPQLPLEVCCDTEQPAAGIDSAGSYVLYSNDAAQAEGVRPGIRVATAQSLCAQLQLHPPAPDALAQKLEQLACLCGHFSAHIIPQPPSLLLLEYASMLRYFKGFPRYQQQLFQQLSLQSYQWQAACATTPAAAELLVTAAPGSFPADQLQTRAALGQIELQLTPLAEPHLRALQGVGFRHLESLFELPRQELKRRFPEPVWQWLESLLGERPDTRKPWQPAEWFEYPVSFQQEVQHAMGLLFPLKSMLKTLAGYLKLRCVEAREIELHLTLADGELCKLVVGHKRGSADAAGWLQLCRLRFESLLLNQPVRDMTLRCEQFSETVQQASDLFAEPQLESVDPHWLSRLAIRMGEHSVCGLQAGRDHRPERFSELVPISQRVRTAHRAVGATGQAARPEPLWLLAVPKPLAELGRGGELLQGPERVCTGWWDQQPVERDYYVMRCADQRLAWVYRNRQGAWFLHGWFG